MQRDRFRLDCKSYWSLARRKLAHCWQIEKRLRQHGCRMDQQSERLKLDQSGCSETDMGQ